MKSLRVVRHAWFDSEKEFMCLSTNPESRRRKRFASLDNCARVVCSLQSGQFSFLYANPDSVYVCCRRNTVTLATRSRLAVDARLTNNFLHRTQPILC